MKLRWRWQFAVTKVKMFFLTTSLYSRVIFNLYAARRHVNRSQHNTLVISRLQLLKNCTGEAFFGFFGRKKRNK